MSPWKALVLGLPARLLATAAVVAALSACGPPSYRFTASDTDDLALKIPRSWNVVRSGVPTASDGTPAAAGNWLAIYDGADRPSMDHVNAEHTTAPIALVRTVVLTKEQGASVTDDMLRDVMIPVTDKARASALLQGFSATGFRLLSDQKITGRTANGVHVVFRYDLGQGTEVFDQIAVTDRTRTRVHLMLVRCNQSCYDSNQRAIHDTVGSFTVRTA